MNDISIVEYVGRSESDCGYCKEAARPTFGLWAHTLTAADYQTLLDRGWRRSGKYCYKPITSQACCCLYTIRCEALRLSLSKSQKRVLKRMRKYLITGEKRKCKTSTYDADSHTQQTSKIRPEISATKENLTVNSNFGDKVKDQAESRANNNDKIVTPDQKRMRKAKYRRRQRKIDRLTAKGLRPVLEDRSGVKKTVEDFFQHPNESKSLTHRLKIRVVRSSPPDVKFEESFLEVFDVYKKYQVAVHKDDADDVTERGFKRFLCDSPLIAQPFDMTVSGDDVELPEHFGYGSYHQHYLIDDKIIAVGVIDILTHCVSSKYFFYDPAFDFLDLGVFSALREAALVRLINKFVPDIAFYYMGYYLHNNPKMRYKGNYTPSFLLCPEAFTWQPIELCRPLLDSNKYSRLEPVQEKLDEDADVNLDDVIVLYERTGMLYRTYKRRRRATNRDFDDQTILQYAKLVGKNCCNSMYLYRSSMN